MNPLSIIGSIISVLQLTATVVKYLNDIKNTSKDQKRCVIEASNLLALLTKLKCCLEEAAPTDPLHARARQLATENGILDQYKAALELLVAKVVPKSGAGKVAAVLLWSFNKKESKEILGTIERLKSSLLIDFQADHFKLSQAIKEDTRLISSHIQHRQDDELSEVIVNWLSPIDFFAQQTDLASRQQEGTGMWFLDSREFSDWVKGVKTVLFCPGIPGAGKTMISSLVINHLRETSAGVVFLYCNYKEDKERKVVNLLSALLKQLVQELPHIPVIVQTLHETHKKKKTRPSLSEISMTIRRVFEDYTIVFIIVDALDECPDEYRDALLSELKNLLIPRVRLMVTSRPTGTISESFEDSLQLPIKAHGEDIKRLVEGQISRLARCVSESRELRQRVISAIHDAVVADGIFLLAQLLIESLVNKFSPRTVGSALKSLPRGSEALSQTYRDAVARIINQAPECSNLAKMALSWIIYAKRPLSVKEFQHALATEIGERQLDEDNIIHISDIVSVCAGLVTIDGQSGVVRLVHYTAQEYFDKMWSSIFPAAQEYIAMTCISYLSFDAFQIGTCLDEWEFDARLGSHALLGFRALLGSDALLDSNALLESHALYKYAASNWSYHARAASVEENKLILNFLRNNAKVSASWEAVESPLRTYTDFKWMVHVTGMHLAAYFGLKNTITALLNIGHDPRSRDTHSGTPLFYATRNGQDGVVRQLLDTNGVYYPKYKDEFGRTLLSYASECGQKTVLKLLLERDDINPDYRDNDYRTPLSHAAEHGHEEIVRFLLATNDVDLDSMDTHRRTPLSYAAEYGHKAIVKLLLAEDRVNPNYKDDKDWTPLSYASRRHKEVVELLLEEGVDPDIKAQNGQTPLSLAAQNGQEAIVKLLLDAKGVDPNSRDKAEMTPLSYAANRRSSAVVKLLLTKPGIDPDSEDKKGWTPLWFAVAAENLWQRESVVRVLLADTRINPNHKDLKGQTPLSYVAAQGNEEMAKLLLASDRIDPNSNDTRAASNNEKRIGGVQLLLSKYRIDPDFKDANGRTPLSYAAEKGWYIEVIPLLLADNRIDPDSKDAYGRTPLSHAAEKTHYGAHYGEVVKLLLADNRVDPDSKDAYGRTPLSYAAEKTHYREVVKLLLADNRVDPDSKDSYGRTPLSYAAKNRNNNKVAGLLLAQSGVDPNSKDTSGRTPLSHAVEKGCLEAVELLLATGRVGLNSIFIGNHNLLSWAAENWYNSIVKISTMGDVVFSDLTGLHWTPPLADENNMYQGLSKVLSMENSTYICPDRKHNRSPISKAVENWHEVVIKLLLIGNRNYLVRESSEAEKWCTGVVKLLLANDSGNLKFRDSFGRTLLWWIARIGYEEAARLLLETKGVEPESTDEHSRTPLFGAVINRHDMIVRLLLARNDVNPDHRDKFGLTPLLLAAWQGSEAIVRLLLADNRIDPNFKNPKDGMTPLSLAANKGHEIVVELLLVKDNVDPDPRNEFGETPLWLAACQGHAAVVKLLLTEESVDPNSRDFEYGDTPLSMAAIEGHEPVVKLLLAKKNILLNPKNDDNQTPLWLAASNGHKDIVKLLLERNDDDLNTQDSEYGTTPLSEAACRGHTAVVELLLAQDCIDIDTKSIKNGRTPLSLAAENGHVAVVKLLLQKGGVDLNSRDAEGLTPLAWAKSKRNWEMVNLLTSYSATYPGG